MRIPFPERILYSHALIFALVLFAVQMLERTNLFFASGCFAFILVSIAAFNIAGGFPYPSGAYIGFNAIFTLIIPLCVKAVLGEPAESNLRAPVRSIEVYLIGMTAMLGAALVSRRFRNRRPFLQRFMPLGNLRGAYLGSIIISILLAFVVVVAGNEPGTFGSFALQVNRFPTLALLLGPIVTIRATNGNRSLSLSNALVILGSCLLGFIGFSKEALLTPFFCWAVAAAAVGFRVRWVNVLALAAGGYITFAYMLPYAQIGRNYETPAGLSQVQVSLFIANHFNELRETYDENAQNVGSIHYYNRDLPLLDRLDIFSIDDALIDYTDRYGTFGFEPIASVMKNFVPHFLWANKGHILYGNLYAHELGILPVDDESTGVSFSPSADAYHEGRISGLLIAMPIILIIFFLVYDSIFGDVRLHPVGLMATVFMARIGNEGTLVGPVAMLAQPLFAILLAAFFCSYILPVISGVFMKPSMPASDSSAKLISATPDPLTLL